MSKLLLLPMLLILTSCAIEDTPEPKYICTQSHTEYKIEYGYGFTLSGKLGWGLINKRETICDTQELNPKYMGELG